jgi:hypothetical protein
MRFLIPLSAEARAALDHRQSELARLYELTNLELAAELMNLVAAARLERPDMTVDREVYDSSLLWHVIPEVARRLGATCAPSEKVEPKLQLESPQEFRRTIGIYLRFVARYETGTAWNILTNEACNGNPLVFAVDRLCPGDLEDKEDWITRGIKEVAHHRGVAYEGVWMPEMLDSVRSAFDHDGDEDASAVETAPGTASRP